MKNLSSVLKSVTFIFFSIIFLLSLVSYNPQDIAFVTYPTLQKATNFIGIGGAYVAFALFFVFGWASYFIPLCFLGIGLHHLCIMRFSGLGKEKIINTISFVFFIIFLAAFIGLFFNENTAIFKYSGLAGFFVSGFFKKYLGLTGSFITLLFLMSISGILFFGFFIVDLFRIIKLGVANCIDFIRATKQVDLFGQPKTPLPKKEKNLLSKAAKLVDAGLKKKEVSPQVKKENLPAEKKPDIKPEIKFYNPKADVGSKENVINRNLDKEKEINKEAIKKKMESLESEQEKKFDPASYVLPQVSLLKVPPLIDEKEVKGDIEASIKNLEETLAEFDVEAKVVSVQKGPVVTMYELAPSAGVKIQKISALSDDIAMAMKTSAVRIVAPLPGRGTVGVEIPNEKKHLVYLREVIEDKAFTAAASKLSLAIGKDVAGNPVVADLNEMPHLLIAGTTGAGKTICVNTLIMSILFKAKPDEVKFILIDPKMVELAHFAGMPHLIHPIISEAKKAFGALSWAVEEMERRYRLLASVGVRNIDAYNKGGKKLSYIVIVVDEFADLMMVARENIETSVQRLAQLSRAVGIHLILATQRPSVDVITGVIKANFPARVSFKVSARVDSRTVLDAMGADKLLGKGDLLFLKPGAVKLIRAQGAFIDDEDIESLTSFIRAQGGPIYEQGIAESEKRKAMNVEEDELFDEAVKTVLQARQASASILQRRLRVGYTRAARLLDLMEQAGVVGPFCGSKAREILVDPETYVKQPDNLPSAEASS